MKEQQISVIFQFIYHILLIFVKLLAALLVAVGLVTACRGSYQFCYQVFGPVTAEEKPGTDRIFSVSESDTMYQVASRLEQERLIVSRFSFYMRVQLSDTAQTKLQPGEYTLNTCMDYGEIIDELTVSE
ncbi:MAG: endolytic transglycosylase MltG [Clostridiaceae bacterium]|nr:endolytic transglycosylase MltG [Clostridiaceae bacterium]